tara:strand:- start:46808 stop:47491 length:684 start_codon:yes stop_codon:yes gene_type:complete
MRFLVALAGALIITLGVFLFMQSLIKSTDRAERTPLVFADVAVMREPEPADEPEPEEEQPPEVQEQPVMEPLTTLAVTPPTPTVTQKLEMPALEFAAGDIDVSAVGDRWSVPLGAAGLDLEGGADAQGFVEVVPFNTRRPNVPLEAWENKVNGWVLVAFSVTPDGNTRDIRVLDARPRGVFEEKVIAAVDDWQYNVRFTGKRTGNVVLTQKLEIQWEDYPRNMPNVD